MAVTECELNRVPRSAQYSIGRDSTLSVSIPVTWLVTTDDVTDGPIEVYNGAKTLTLTDPLPNLWATYSIGGDSDANLYLLDVNLRQRDSNDLKHWLITGTYKTLTVDQSPQDNETDPLLRPVKYWIESDAESEQIEEGWNVQALPRGKEGSERAINTYGPIVNSAGQQFAGVLHDTRNRIVLVAEKNYATLQQIINIAIKYDHTTNEDSFHGAARHHAAFQTISCSQIREENGISYYTGTIRILISREAILRRINNTGLKYWEDGELINAKDTNNINVSEPVNLKLDGTKLPEGEESIVVEYRTLKEERYQDMGI